MLAVTRKNRKAGRNRASRYINIPQPVDVGEESSIVVGPLLLADPEGKISPEELKDFFEEKVAPAWYQWREKHGNE